VVKKRTCYINSNELSGGLKRGGVRGLNRVKKGPNLKGNEKKNLAPSDSDKTTIANIPYHRALITINPPSALFIIRKSKEIHSLSL
jgi:hypothetical protein